MFSNYLPYFTYFKLKFEIPTLCIRFKHRQKIKELINENLVCEKKSKKYQRTQCNEEIFLDYM